MARGMPHMVFFGERYRHANGGHINQRFGAYENQACLRVRLVQYFDQYAIKPKHVL